MTKLSYNRIVITATKDKMLHFINGAMPEAEQFSSIIPWIDIVCSLNERWFTMRSWFPMPQTFYDYDTTKPKYDILSWADACIERAEEDELYLQVRHRQISIEEFTTHFQHQFEAYQVGYDRAVAYQKEEYGVVGWRDYNIMTLGTKWDADITEWEIVEETDDQIVLSIYMETAWCPPFAFLDTVADKYDVKILLYAESEQDKLTQLIDINEGKVLDSTDADDDDERHRKSMQIRKKLIEINQELLSRPF